MKTYYDILEVSKSATTEVINRAHKVLVKRYHPDLQQDEASKKEAAQKMIEVNDAYEVLSDEFKRRKYDEKLAKEEEIQKLKEMQEMQKKMGNAYSTNNARPRSNVNSSSGTYSQSSSAHPSQVKQSDNNIASQVDYQQQMYQMAYETEMQKRKMLHDMEIDHYRRMGYKIVYPVTFREVMVKIAIFTVFALIFIAVFNIPFFDNQIHELCIGNKGTELIYKLFKNIFTFKWLGR